MKRKLVMKPSNIKAESCEMHSCLRNTMRLSRWAGVFPVVGLNTPDIGKLRYNMKSFYTLYYLSTIVMLTIITGFMFHWFLINDLNLTTLSNLVFYVTGLLSTIFLLKLAREWPSLVRRAATIERRIADIHTTKIRAGTFNALTYVVLGLAAIEHLLSLVFKIKNVALCYDEALFGKDILNYYFRRTFPFVFEYVSSNIFTAAVCTFANIQATFIWNFTDVMTMCLSLYLTTYFGYLNKIINSQSEKRTHGWEQLRYYYSQLVALVQAVDSKMCYLILISIFTNLFFICFQIYNTLNSRYQLTANCISQPKEEIKFIDRGISLVYYAYSSAFLMLRAAVMFFLTTNVNTAAKEPKLALYHVSSGEYDIHVQRFNRQLRYTTTALSGLFFYVTRGMILKVFATIVTYELVLLQFNYKT